MKYDLVYLVIGALLGVFLRYKMTGSPLFLGSLPISVLLVNVIGSFVLGASSTAVSTAVIGLEVQPETVASILELARATTAPCQ